MKRALLAALALLLFVSPALAQSNSCSGTLPANVLCGRLGTVPGPSQAIPFATIQSLIGGGGSVANPTATIGLSPVNGVLSTALRSDGAPALSQAITPTWTAPHIYSPTSGDAITINGVANTNNKAINITQSGPTSGTVAGPINLNLVNVTSYNAATTGTKFADFGAWSSSVTAFRSNFTVGGANVTSGTEPFMAMLGHIRATTATAAGNVDFEGVTGISYTNVALGGTMEGVVGAIVVDNGGSAAFVAGVFAEADILTGGSAVRRYGIWIDSEGFLTASGDDAAIGIGSIRNAASFKNAIVLNTTGGGVPIQTTGNIITATAAFTVANAFDLSQATISGNIIQTPNMTLTGAGALVLAPAAATPAAGVKLTVNKNTVAVPLILGAGSVTAQFASADGTLSRVAIVAPGGIPVINFIASLGTLATPTATQNTNTIGAFGAFGYGATAYGTNGGASILFTATQNWTDTAQGASITFGTAANGTTTVVAGLTIQNSGGVSIGTAPDPGIGFLAASKAVQTVALTVATLPTCNAGSEGARAYVTDQNTAVAYRGAVTGTGTTRQAVLCSNSAWIQD